MIKYFFAASMAAGLAIAFLIGGCLADHAAHSESNFGPASSVQEQIKPLVEQLFLNYKTIDGIFHDLQAVAQAHLFQADDAQLNYVQKACLYVQKAALGAYHQWDILSILEDIRPAALRDYYTLRHKGLLWAAGEIDSDIRFLNLYREFISNTTAREDIDQALGVMKANRELYGRMAEIIAPLINKARPDATL